MNRRGPAQNLRRAGHQCAYLVHHGSIGLSFVKVFDHKWQENIDPTGFRTQQTSDPLLLPNFPRLKNLPGPYVPIPYLYCSELQLSNAAFFTVAVEGTLGSPVQQHTSSSESP